MNAHQVPTTVTRVQPASTLMDLSYVPVAVNEVGQVARVSKKNCEGVMCFQNDRDRKTVTLATCV